MSRDRPHEAAAPRAAVAAALFALLLAANLPTPLYAVYRERFGFSSVVLPLIFAVYALVLVPTLLVFGQTPDRLGRRAFGGLTASCRVPLPHGRSTAAPVIRTRAAGAVSREWRPRPSGRRPGAVRGRGGR